MTGEKMATQEEPPVVQFPSVNSIQRSDRGRSKVSLQPGHSLMDWIRLGNTGVDLTGTGGKLLKVTPEELAKHNKPGDAWIGLKGRVYNVSRYLDYHPGGHDELFRGVGIDATDLFNEVHRWINFESMLKKCLVGKLIGSISTNSWKNTKQGLLPSSNSLRPPSLPPPKAKLGGNSPTPPRFDWFQNNEIISLIIYARSKSVNLNSIIINCPDGQAFSASILLSTHVYIIHLELEHKIHPSYNVKVSAESGTIEIILRKENAELQWSNLGNPLPNHKLFVKCQERDLNYQSCCLLKKERVTHDTYLFTFKLPEGCRMSIPIGHHVHLKAQYDGCEVSRSYTAVIPQIDIPAQEISDAVMLMIKIYSDGALTSVIDTIAIGDYIDISEYIGNFDEQYLKKYTHLYLLAAGTGFTPMIRLINYCLFIASSNCRLVSLMFFNKTEADILWHEQLSNLKSEFGDKFQVKHVLSSADDNWKGARGRISKDLLSELFLPSTNSENVNNLIAICGPKGFNESAVKYVKELGYDDDSIHLFQG